MIRIVPFKLKACYLMLVVFFVFTISSQHTHAQDKTVITAQKILSDIDSGMPLIYSNKIISDSLDFTEFHKKYKEICSSNETYQKVIILSNITFYNCEFQNDVVCFKKDSQNHKNNLWVKTVSVFEKSLRFVNCIFNKNIILKSSHFREDLSFSGCNVSGDVIINGTEIDGKLFIHQNNTSRKLSVNKSFVGRDFIVYGNKAFILEASESIFNSDVIINSNEITDFVDFYKSHINGDINVSNSIFNHNVDFSMSRFDGNTLISSTEFKSSSSFVECEFSKVKIEKTKFHGKADFFRSVFKGRSTISAEFLGPSEFNLNAYYKDFHIINSFFTGEPSFKNIYVLNSFYIYNSQFKDFVNFGSSDFVGNFSIILSDFDEGAVITNCYFLKTLPKIINSNFNGKLVIEGSYYNQNKLLDTDDL